MFAEGSRTVLLTGRLVIDDVDKAIHPAGQAKSQDIILCKNMLRANRYNLVISQLFQSDDQTLRGGWLRLLSHKR